MSSIPSPAPVNVAAAATNFLIEELGLPAEGVMALCSRIMDEKPTKVGYSPGVGCSPILSEVFGTTELGEDRFSVRFDWVLGEVFATKGPSDQRLLYPVLTELACGTTLEELRDALNRASGRPWVLMRSAKFFYTLFPDDESGRKLLESFHLVSPWDWWVKQGISEAGLERMRPGGLIWRDMDEATSGRHEWVLLGAE